MNSYDPAPLQFAIRLFLTIFLSQKWKLLASEEISIVVLCRTYRWMDICVQRMKVHGKYLYHIYTEALKKQTGILQNIFTISICERLGVKEWEYFFSWLTSKDKGSSNSGIWNSTNPLSAIWWKLKKKKLILSLWKWQYRFITSEKIFIQDMLLKLGKSHQNVLRLNQDPQPSSPAPALKT